MTHTATDLGAIVRATRASANALARMQRYGAKLGRLGTHGNLPELRRAYRNAERAYHRAQSILAANPLPGDSSVARIIQAAGEHWLSHARTVK
jgi:hypothetical protein